MNPLEDLQSKIQQVFDLINEGQWHPEAALQALTVCLGSIAVAVNVPLEDLLKEANRGLTDIYQRNEAQNNDVQ